MSLLTVQPGVDTYSLDDLGDPAILGIVAETDEVRRPLVAGIMGRIRGVGVIGVDSYSKLLEHFEPEEYKFAVLGIPIGCGGDPLRALRSLREDRLLPIFALARTAEDLRLAGDNGADGAVLLREGYLPHLLDIIEGHLG